MNAGHREQNFWKSDLVARAFWQAWWKIELKKSCGYTFKKSFFDEKFLSAPNVRKPVFGANECQNRSISTHLTHLSWVSAIIFRNKKSGIFSWNCEIGQNRDFDTSRSRRTFALWIWNVTYQSILPTHLLAAFFRSIGLIFEVLWASPNPQKCSWRS